MYLHPHRKINMLSADQKSNCIIREWTNGVEPTVTVLNQRIHVTDGLSFEERGLQRHGVIGREETRQLLVTISPLGSNSCDHIVMNTYICISWKDFDTTFHQEVDLLVHGKKSEFIYYSERIYFNGN